MADTSVIPEGLITETESFEAKTPVTKIVPSVMKHEAIIINNEKGYYGIIDSAILYRSTPGLSTQKAQAAEKFVMKVPRITDSTTIEDVVAYFAKSRARALPYMKGGKIRGVLKRTTLLKVLLSLGKLGDFRVEDAMVAPLIGTESNATVTQAKAIMRDNKINRLAVMQDGRLLGIVTNYDIVNKYFKPQERLPQRKSDMYNPSNMKLDTVMQTNIKTIDSGKGVSDAVRAMIENNVSSLVVTKGNKPVGIITELDILESVMARTQTSTNRVFISGLTPETYEYEPEIREALSQFLVKIEKFKGVRVDYISLVVRKFKTKSYEIHARLALSGKAGIINRHVEGHIFERTLSDLLEGLTKDMQVSKERYLTVRKVLHNAHPEEELE